MNICGYDIENEAHRDYSAFSHSLLNDRSAS